MKSLKSLFDPMTREKAIQVYFGQAPRSLKAVEKIMRWNPKLTAGENGKRLGFSYGGERPFAARYRLRSTKSWKLTPFRDDIARAKRLKKAGLTHHELAKLYDITRQNVEYTLKTYKKGK